MSKDINEVDKRRQRENLNRKISEFKEKLTETLKTQKVKITKCYN